MNALIGTGPLGPLTYHNALLHLVPQDRGDLSAAALDGSPYGFYFQPSPTHSKRWTIEIQGGGWCYNEELCWERSKTTLGSSKHLPAHYGCKCMNVNTDDGGLVDDCNCINMPYLDGASFTGYRAKPWPVSNTTASYSDTNSTNSTNSTNDKRLYFRGIRNFDAVIEFCLWHGMAQADEVVLTGGSAGGLSTFLHLDRVATAVQNLQPNCRVYGVPVVGYFLDHDTFPGVRPTHTLPSNYPDMIKYIYHMQNLTFGMDGGLTKACETAFSDTPHYCFMAPHMHPYITHPFYMFNSKFDFWQLRNELQIHNWTTNSAQAKAVVQYGMDFVDQFVSIEHAGHNGAFITSCICHGCDWYSTAYVDDNSSDSKLSPLQHYAKWVHGETSGFDSIYIDKEIIPNQGGKLDGKDRCEPFFPSSFSWDEQRLFETVKVKAITEK